MCVYKELQNNSDTFRFMRQYFKLFLTYRCTVLSVKKSARTFEIHKSMLRIKDIETISYLFIGQHRRKAILGAMTGNYWKYILNCVGYLAKLNFSMLCGE